MTHGWLDGRRGLPLLPVVEHPPTIAPIVPEANGTVSARPRLLTPRMDVLTRQALELINAEGLRFADEYAVLKREETQYRIERDAVRRELEQCQERVKLAEDPLTEDEIEGRRFAELDPARRPPELTRARRRAAWQRRVLEAQQARQSAVARLAEATHEYELRGDLIRDRAAVARAAARRHHELGQRRIATYLQTLVRTHKQGIELNLLLTQYPVGPGLPGWTREPGEGQDGIEQMFTGGSAPLTHDSYLSQ